VQEASNGRPREAPRKVQGQKLPQKAFRAPLLAVLSELGGSAAVKEIKARLEPRIAALLGEGDYQLVSSGDERWWNAVCWERNDLVKEGLLRADSDRGVWELSPTGLARALDSGTPAATDIEHAARPEAAMRNDPASSPASWRDDIESVLDQLDHGSGASLQSIYTAAKELRTAAGRSVPESLEATVRRTLEDNCSDSDNFRGQDVFYMPKGKGAGVWGLRRKRRP